MILGIDEVGRGPWAGPLVVGAVVLRPTTIDGLTDSKKLSAKKRQQFDAVIRQTAAGWGLGWVHAEELDRIGLAAALRLATIRAVEAIHTPYSEIIIDGTINFLKETSKGKYVTTLAKADLLIPSVSAASILAKVARDTYMAEQALVYPHYGFEKHVGYGTAVHRQAIDTYGVTPLHRTSFAPIAKLLNTQAISRPKSSVKTTAITSKDIGDKGEDQACMYLEGMGHTVIHRNWKTKWCEIDVISKLQDTVYFVEVKSRRTSNAGKGYDAITATKLKQMKYAAEFYMASHKSTIPNSKLAVVSITGSNIEYLQVE
jgi:ribonuclease HII